MNDPSAAKPAAFFHFSPSSQHLLYVGHGHGQALWKKKKLFSWYLKALSKWAIIIYLHRPS